MKEKGVSHIAYFRLDGGSSKLYTQEYVDEKDKEIERLKDDNKYLNKINIELSSEKNRLRSIIKEVREYIKENTISYYTNLEHTEEEFEVICDPKELLEILDKEKE